MGYLNGLLLGSLALDVVRWVMRWTLLIPLNALLLAQQLIALSRFRAHRVCCCQCGERLGMDSYRSRFHTLVIVLAPYSWQP